MAKKVARKNAKQIAYEKKQEKEGVGVVKWIFIGLIVLALAFAVYSVGLAQ